MASVEVSCEYLASDKSCIAVSENPKAKAVRQVRCRNEEKMTCCYLCVHGRKCDLSCSFLGKMDHEPPKAENAKTVEAKSEVIVEGAQGVSCSSCKVIMREGKTKIRISGWEESGQKQSFPVSEESEKEWLPVKIYLCPQCGKIEFVAG